LDFNNFGIHIAHVEDVIMGATDRQDRFPDTAALAQAANDNSSVPARTNSPFPADAVARIYKPTRSVTTSGHGRTKGWRLTFERRTPPFIEPLMGYTGGDDMLVQVELNFPSLAAAKSYAERNGFAYRVESQEAGVQAPAVVTYEPATEIDDALAGYLSLAWMQTQYGLGGPTGLIDVDRALLDPAAVFAKPGDVLADPSLTVQNKHDILQRWAWDEYLIELASNEAMPEAAAPSRLDQVKSALLELEREPIQVALVRNPDNRQAA
jgi:hypothetical protein